MNDGMDRGGRRRLVIGMVGLGMASAPHVAALQALADDIAVAGVYSPNAERRGAFARRHGLPEATSLEGLLASPGLGAVLVLTPPSTHLDLVRAACAAGKHVLLEKPLDITLERAEAVVETARSAGLCLGIVLQRRCRPSLAAVRSLLAAGALGDLVSASVRVANWRPQSYYDVAGRGTYARDGGGVLLTQAIHAIDQLIWLVGTPETVMARAATSRAHRMEAEDIVHAVIGFSNGAIGTIAATTAAYPGFADTIEIIGTRGSVQIDPGAARLFLLDGTEEVIADDTDDGGAGADPMAFSSANHTALIADFAQAVRAGRAPIASGQDALKVHRVIEAILRSARLGTQVQVENASQF